MTQLLNTSAKIHIFGLLFRNDGKIQTNLSHFRMIFIRFSISFMNCLDLIFSRKNIGLLGYIDKHKIGFEVVIAWDSPISAHFRIRIRMLDGT